MTKELKYVPCRIQKDMLEIIDKEVKKDNERSGVNVWDRSKFIRMLLREALSRRGLIEF